MAVVMVASGGGDRQLWWPTAATGGGGGRWQWVLEWIECRSYYPFFLKDYTLDSGGNNQFKCYVARSERVAETSKKGFCLFELKRSGLVEWGVRQVKFLGHQEDSTAKQLSGKIEEEYDEDDKNHVNNDLISFPEVKKRKCLSSNHLTKKNAPRCGKQKLNSGPKKGKRNKHNNSIERLSPARYNLAEGNMLEFMMTEGAVFENPAKLLLDKIEEDYDEDGERHMITELISSPEVRNKKFLSSNQPIKERAPRCGEEKLNSGLHKGKQNKPNNSLGILSAERYIPAKESMLEIMKVEETVFEIPARESFDKIEEEYDEDNKTLTELISCPEVRKRKYLSSGQPREERATRCGKQKLISGPNKGKQNNHKNSVERWSAERYKLAEEKLLEILKGAGAVFEKPVSRPDLRMAARKVIGDTGLLDHLLKHVDGKVAPGGIDRFRRCYNTSGVMEYWLERADLANMRKEAGVFPFWQKPDGGSLHDSTCSIELNWLKNEMTKMKRDMQELVSKQQEREQANLIEQMQKEMVKCKVKTDERLMEFSCSLNGMQNMCKELMTWKAKVEQQMLEITNSLSSLLTSKQCTIFSPSASDRWEDWLESTNLDNFQEGNLAPWLESPELINFGQHGVQDTNVAPVAWSRPGSNPLCGPICAQELDMPSEEMAKIKSDVQELAPRKQEEVQANITPGSSFTAISKLDLDNPLLLFQETLKDLVNWKAKTKQQLMEISSAVSAIQTSGSRQ